MNFEEAVKLLQESLEKALNDADDEEQQEAIENIVSDFYGFEFGDDERTDDEEVMLEDLAWAQIGSAALIRIAASWSGGTPPGIRYLASEGGE